MFSLSIIVIPITGLLHKRDWPKYVDPIRPIYEPEDLTAFFSACQPAEKTLFVFYLLTGMRDKKFDIRPGRMWIFAARGAGYR